MSELVATPDAIRAYGDASAAMATGVVTAAAFDLGAVIAALGPVLGPIGQEVMFASAYAHGNLASSTIELAGVHAATAVTAHQSAAAYESAEGASVGEFGTVNNA